MLTTTLSAAAAETIRLELPITFLDQVFSWKMESEIPKNRSQEITAARRGNDGRRSEIRELLPK
jgi:hypothetical protein